MVDNDYTILFIDDDPLHRRTARDILEAADDRYDIETAEPADSPDATADQYDGHDAVVTDQKFQDRRFNGDTIYDRLKDEVPVIFFTRVPQATLESEVQGSIPDDQYACDYDGLADRLGSLFEGG